MNKGRGCFRRPLSLAIVSMILRIKVKPGSKADELVTEADGTLKVKIRAQPVEGKANKYLLEYLAGVLGIPKSKIILLKGETNSFKTLQVDADEGVIRKKLFGSSNSTWLVTLSLSKSF